LWQNNKLFFSVPVEGGKVNQQAFPSIQKTTVSVDTQRKEQDKDQTEKIKTKYALNIYKCHWSFHGFNVDNVYQINNDNGGSVMFGCLFALIYSVYNTDRDVSRESVLFLISFIPTDEQYKLKRCSNKELEEKPRLLFSRAGYASRGLSLSSVLLTRVPSLPIIH